MATQRHRDEFIAEATRAGLRVDQARSLLRYAATLQRLAEAQCNGDWPADNGERKTAACPICENHWAPSTIKTAGCPDCRTEALVKRALEGSTLVPEFHGDPRGAVLRLYQADSDPKDRESGRARAIYVP